MMVPELTECAQQQIMAAKKRSRLLPLSTTASPHQHVFRAAVYLPRDFRYHQAKEAVFRRIPVLHVLSSVNKKTEGLFSRYLFFNRMWW